MDDEQVKIRWAPDAAAQYQPYGRTPGQVSDREVAFVDAGLAAAAPHIAALPAGLLERRLSNGFSHDGEDAEFELAANSHPGFDVGEVIVLKLFTPDTGIRVLVKPLDGALEVLALTSIRGPGL